MKTHVAYEKKYRRVKAKLLDSQYILGAYRSTIEAERDAIRTRNGVTHQRLHRWIKRLLDGVRPGTLVEGKQTIATNMLDSLLVELQDEARHYYLNSDELLADCERCQNRRAKKVNA